MIGLAIAVATAIPPQIAAAPPTPVTGVAVSPAAVSRTTAATLARTVAPADVMIPFEIDQARKGILGLPQMDEEAKQLESDYPGIWSAVWTAIEPEMRRWVEADYPAFWAALEQLYAARLTEQEAQALLTFYRSPTGQKLLRGMVQNFDASPILKDVLASPSSTVSAEQMSRVTNAAKSKAVATIGPEDTGEVMILMHYIDLEKFQSLGAETQKVTLDWVNKADPEGDKRLEELMRGAMERYMAAHLPAKKSK
jgi:hypothetical protein